MIALFKCKTCGRFTKKRYAWNRKRPEHCSRQCIDQDREHQVLKARKTALTRWPTKAIRAFVCEQCSRDFTTQGEPRHRRFCSHRCSCQHRTKLPKITKPCKTCGKDFTYAIRPNRKMQEHCSRPCAFMDQDRSELIRMQTLKDLRAGKFTHSLTNPVRTVITLLESLGIRYSREWISGRRAYDFYLTDFRQVIEVHGDYWHANPKVYTNGPINDVQRQSVRRDKQKALHLKRQNIPLLILWEHDINRALEACLNQLVRFINHSQQELLFDHAVINA